MNIDFATQGGRTVITPRLERLDAAVAQAFKDQCVAQVDSHHLVFDLSEVKFVDSTGLGALVAVLKHLGEDGKLSVVSTTPGILMLLQVTRLDSIFSVFPSLEQALQ